jgi:hypothetical protein
MPMEPTSKPTTNQEPLTDPADLLALLGRFMAACVLMVMTLALLLQRHYMIAIITGGVTLLLQLATTRTWRRLREERLTKLAEREARQAQETEASA